MGKPIPGGCCGGYLLLFAALFGACCDCFSRSNRRRNNTQSRENYINTDRYQSSGHTYDEDGVEYVNE